MTDTTTSQACLQAAFQALLHGNTAERDRLCERAKALLDAEHKASAVERIMAVDFYVTAHGEAVPTKAMAQAAGALH